MKTAFGLCLTLLTLATSAYARVDFDNAKLANEKVMIMLSEQSTWLSSEFSVNLNSIRINNGNDNSDSRMMAAGSIYDYFDESFRIAGLTFTSIEKSTGRTAANNCRLSFATQKAPKEIVGNLFEGRTDRYVANIYQCSIAIDGDVHYSFKSLLNYW
ncbi:MAG: hypothetical protein V4736_01710 [Bdellovibrionota bacterium]